MRIAITGGTGFVGGHFAEQCLDAGHEVVLIARGTEGYGARLLDDPDATHVAAIVADREAMRAAIAGCDAVAHLAGINRETGRATYERVHVEGTRAVVDAAEAADVDRLALMSFLRARPDCGSGYHESKWAAEELVRESDVPHTVLKAGVIYGRGDHMVDHLAKALRTVPVFGLVGRSGRQVAPVAVADVAAILRASLVDGELERATVPVIGPEEMPLAEAVQRVGDVVDGEPWYVRLPVPLHYAIAGVMECTMHEPLTALAQVRILSEGLIEPAPADSVEPLPDDLAPETRFGEPTIRAALPDRLGFGLADFDLRLGDVPATARDTVSMIGQSLRGTA
jgi:uncharacterized protein YbjT (DUF2867 family)